MKRIKLLLAAFAAMAGMSAYAQTDAQYDAALAAVADGDYGIVAVFNAKTYVLKADGFLTDDAAEAATFAISQKATEDASAIKATAFRINTGKRFTNGGNGSNVITSTKNLAVSTQDREQWERQVLYLNDEGKYAVRGTNSNSTSWGASAYWVVVADNDGDELPNATYSFDDVAYVWDFVPEASFADVQLTVAGQRKARFLAKAQAYYDDASYTEGKADLKMAIDNLTAATSVDDIHTETANMTTAIADFLYVNALAGAGAETPVDVTSAFITNPSPYVNGDGWTFTDGTHLYSWVGSAPTYDSGNQNAEMWANQGASIKQTLHNLPAGTYALTAIAFTRTDMISTLYAGEASMPIATVASSVVNGRGDAKTWFNNGNGVNKLLFTLDEDTEDVEIGLIAGTSGDAWTVWRSFTLSYYGTATQADVLLAEAKANHKSVVDAANTTATSLDGKIPAAALAVLNTAIADNNKAYDTVEAYESAIAAINDAVAVANALVYPYTHYQIVSAAAAALDDDTDMYTGTATIDVSEADAAAAAATDEAGINAAILKAQEAVNAFLDAVNLNEGYRFDITNIYLENADFDPNFVTPIPGKLSMPKGWDITISGQNLGQQNRTDTNSETSLSITNFIEAWIPSPSTLGAGVLAQTVAALPEGTYVLECDATGVWQGGSELPENVELFIASAIKTEKAQVQTGDRKIQHYSQSFAHGGEGSVQFGLRITETGTVKANWISADNFKVYYAGPMPLEMYEEMLGETMTAAQDYDKEVPQAAIDALMDVVDDNDKSWTSKDEYRAAIAAINAAVEATDALVTPYADYKAFVKECEVLQAVDNDNEAANATFQAAIESEAIEDCKTLEDIAAVKAALAQARLTYVAEANPANGAKFDLTFMLTNPDLTALASWASAEGWYTDQADGNSQVMNNDAATSEDGTKTKFYEYWSNPAKSNNTFALYQKVTLPAGTYAISCYAFAQDQYTGTNTAGVYFYANDTQGSVVKNAKLTEANIDFVNAVEQEVKIGLKTIDPNTYNWMGIGYVELYKVAPKTINIAENVDYEPVSEAGKVSLTRTIKADTWNTFVVPFQITNDELKAAFGDDVEVAEESEVAHGDLSTISFTKMETPAITPNKPVLLKTSTAGTVYNFEGRTIATSEPVVIGTNFDFVGTYASGKIAAGDYFIGSDKLFLSDGTVNVAGTHAYLKAKAAGVKAELFIDGVATAIESIDAETAQPAGAIYNVAGQRVQKAQRGLYIMGGKKVVVK